MPKNSYWKEADVLLNTPTIKKLAISDSRKLICILNKKQLEKEYLDNFLYDEEIKLDIKKLESEVKGQKIND
jgi:hypothetical protein